MKIEGKLGDSDHEKTEFKILKVGGGGEEEQQSRHCTSEKHFSKLREVVDRIPWDTGLMLKESRRAGRRPF